MKTLQEAEMKLSKSMSGLAGFMALACLLGLAPQQASAAVALSGCAGGDFGDACSMAELVGGGNLAINGNLFSNFGLDLFTGRALNTSVIRVDAIDSFTNPGFTLVDTGGALTFSNGDSTFSNFSFNVATGNPSIQGTNLAMAVGNITGDNSYAHVFANVFDPTLTDLQGQNDVYCDGAIGCANSTLSHSALFPFVAGLSVSAGIDVTGDATGAAQINSITMQIAAVPEPSSAALLMCGLGVVGAVVRSGRFARRDQAAS
jgi:hypothetical protein